MAFHDPLVLLLLFAAFWFGGAALISRAAGWHVLSALYPAPAHTVGQSLRFCTVGLGTARFPLTYRRCVRLVVTGQGIGMGLMFPFRFHSPPFLVPWSCVESCTETQALADRKVVLAFRGTNRQATFSGALGQFVKGRYEAGRQGTA